MLIQHLSLCIKRRRIFPAYWARTWSSWPAATSNCTGVRWTASAISAFRNCSSQYLTSTQWMRSSRMWMRSSRVWMRSSRVRMRSTVAECGWDLAECGWDLAECEWDLAEWLERLTANDVVAAVLGSILASSDTVESEGRQMKQRWISYR